MSPVTAATSRKLSVVLSLLLLAPGAALAEEAVALEAGPPARTELPRSLHLLEDLAERTYDYEEKPTAVRVLAVTGAAALTGTLAALAGSTLTDNFLSGFVAGAVIGAPIGGWWGGKAVGGQGSYLGALGGAALGAGVGILATMALADTAESAALVAFPVATLLGVVLGYEASHDSNSGYAAAAPRFQPTVAVSPRSAALGLGGSF